MKKSNVGASSARPHFEESAKSPLPPRGHGARRATGGSLTSNRGITLIALIITIIVMLILVAVTIQIALNTGLFESAGKATKEWKEEQEAESNLTIKVGDKEYASVDEYMEEINKPVIEPKNIDDWIYTVEEDGTVTLNGYKGTETEVVIPNHINGMPVKKLYHLNHGTPGGYGSFWHRDICTEESANGWGYYYYQRTITKVIISEGIEEIDYRSFYESKALEEIVLPKSLISLNVSDIFQYCDLITIKVPWKEDEVPESWNLEGKTIIYAE